jgi:hypothetical protein
MFNGVSGATYTAAAALDTASGMVTQITANDFQLLCDTIQDYYTNIGESTSFRVMFEIETRIHIQGIL